MLDAAEKGKADPSSIPQLLAGQGVVLLFEKPSARTRASTEMAVVAPRRSPDLRAARGGRPRRARVGRRRRPHLRRVLLGDRGAGVRPRHARGDGGGRRRPGRQPAVRPRPPHAGGGRLPHPAGAVRHARRSSARLRRRRQQRRPRRWRTRAALSGVELTVASPPGYELDDLTRRAGPQPRRHHRARARSLRGGRRRRRGLHRRVDVDGPGGGDRRPAAPRSPATPSTTR